MDSDRPLDYRFILDRMPQAVMLFDAEDRLAHANAAAWDLFGNDLKVIEAEGWRAAVLLFAAGEGGQSVDEARLQAHETGQPVRVRAVRAGEFLPAWVSTVTDDTETIYSLVVVDRPDWSALTELTEQFIHETREAVDSAHGHADLILKSLNRLKPDDPIKDLDKRIGGFTRLIDAQMRRTRRLLDLMARLQAVRLGTLRHNAAANRRPIKLPIFVEDLLEETDNASLLDPETESQDVRDRLRADIPPGLVVAASPGHLANVLREILRNAMMYSAPGSLVAISAAPVGGSVHISVTDTGYGIRPSEYERVFAPFQRARQPQVIAEFGYGLGLFLCRHEVEAMNGRLWFESEEGLGATFSVKLPLWETAARAESVSSSSSDR